MKRSRTSIIRTCSSKHALVLLNSGYLCRLILGPHINFAYDLCSRFLYRVRSTSFEDSLDCFLLGRLCCWPPPSLAAYLCWRFSPWPLIFFGRFSHWPLLPLAASSTMPCALDMCHQSTRARSYPTLTLPKALSSMLSFPRTLSRDQRSKTAKAESGGVAACVDTQAGRAA